MNDYDEGSAASTVFRDIIFLALAGFVVIVLLMLPFLNPPTLETEKRPPGNIIIEMFWPDEYDVDMDMWVKGPDGFTVGYTAKAGSLFNLLRDDLGQYKDVTWRNYENVFSRGIIPGEYIVNVMYYANRYENRHVIMKEINDPEYMAKYDAKIKPTPREIEVLIVVSVKENDNAKPVKVFDGEVVLTHVNQELTAVRFKVGNDLKVVEESINDIQTVLAGGSKTQEGLNP